MSSNRPQAVQIALEAIPRISCNVLRGRMWELHEYITHLESISDTSERDALIAELVGAAEALMQHEQSNFMGKDAAKNCDTSWRGVMRKTRKALTHALINKDIPHGK
jgi:hypothetical protein